MFFKDSSTNNKWNENCLGFIDDSNMVLIKEGTDFIKQVSPCIGDDNEYGSGCIETDNVIFKDTENNDNFFYDIQGDIQDS